MIHNLKSPKQGCFVVKGLACVSNKNRWDTQGAIQDKGMRCWIPGRVPPSLKRVSYATIGKRRCIWLCLNQHVPIEFFNGKTIRGWLKKSIMLFSCGTGQGLKPMGVMGRLISDGPCLHGSRHLI